MAYYHDRSSRAKIPSGGWIVSLFLLLSKMTGNSRYGHVMLRTWTRQLNIFVVLYSSSPPFLTFQFLLCIIPKSCVYTNSIFSFCLFQQQKGQPHETWHHPPPPRLQRYYLVSFFFFLFLSSLFSSCSRVDKQKTYRSFNLSSTTFSFTSPSGSINFN